MLNIYNSIILFQLPFNERGILTFFHQHFLRVILLYRLHVCYTLLYATRITICYTKFIPKIEFNLRKFHFNSRDEEV